MDASIDHLPNPPLPYEDLVKLTAQGSLCIVKLAAQEACKRRICESWEGSDCTSLFRNMVLSVDWPAIPGSTGKHLDFSQNGFIERLSIVAQAFCCEDHAEDREIHAYFAYMWVASDITARGPDCVWEREQLSWFGLRPDSESLGRPAASPPPYINENKDFCYLDSLERCANYLPAMERQRFAAAFYNMVQQGKAMTRLDHEQLLHVDPLLERLESTVKRRACTVSRLLTDVPSLQSTLHNDNLRGNADINPTANIRSLSYLPPWSLHTWFAHETCEATAA